MTPCFRVHLPTHRSQQVSRGRCPFSDSGVVSGPQASAGYPIASGDSRSHRGGPSGHGAFSSACKPRDRTSGRRGVFFCVQLGALGGARPLSEYASREPRGEAFDRYQAPRQATFVSTLLLKLPAKVGLAPAQPGAAPFGSTNGKRRARRPGTEQSRLNVKLLRGASGPGAVPLLPDPRMAPRQASCLLDRTRSPLYPPGAAPSFGSQRSRRRSPRDFTVTQSKE
jgi:hypothetical protein